MKKVLLWLWQLPQNILGLLVILFTGARLELMLKSSFYKTDKFGWFGVSLGNYIIFGGSPSKASIKHEHGHQIQSMYLGPLYLIIIGLPSLLGNIYARLFNKDSTWYYKQPWEAWADKLGGVGR